MPDPAVRLPVEAASRPMPRRGETRNERFRRVAQRRVQEVLHRLDVLRSLASHNYEYSELEGQQLIAAIEERVDELKEHLLARHKPRPHFTFD